MFDYTKYLREDKFPHIWCPGCGNGTLLKALIRAIDRLGLEKDSVAMVSGIGCSSRTPGYVDFNTLHTTHGRPIPFAVGIKAANPKMNVIVVTGDGDGTAIGGNHFIHNARRNIDITVLLYNNRTYGMTGGQASPTTLVGDFATTAPYGSVDQPFDISRLAEAAGASFVARGTTYHAPLLTTLIEKAIRKKGFSVVEIYTQCPTYYRGRGKRISAMEMITMFKETCVTVEKAKKMSPEELKDKTVIGVLCNKDLPEYLDEYQKKIIDVARKR
jgi:2-oxoglutarate ferredoxin oxidoreductase subunit beta